MCLHKTNDYTKNVPCKETWQNHNNNMTTEVEIQLGFRYRTVRFYVGPLHIDDVRWYNNWEISDGIFYAQVTLK